MFQLTMSLEHATNGSLAGEACKPCPGLKVETDQRVKLQISLWTGYSDNRQIQTRASTGAISQRNPRPAYLTGAIRRVNPHLQISRKSWKIDLELSSVSRQMAPLALRAHLQVSLPTVAYPYGR